MHCSQNASGSMKHEDSNIPCKQISKPGAI